MSDSNPQPVLDLDESPRVTVLRSVENVMRNDPVLKRVVDRWLTYEGDPSDDDPAPKSADVSITLSPGESPTEWYSPDSQVEEFTIRVQCEVNSWCINDPMNLWRAIEKSFYTRSDADESDTVRKGLVDAGCQTGQPLFSPPQFGQSVDADGLPSGRFIAAGEIKLTIMLPINP